jgi:hypothetical protein
MSAEGAAPSRTAPHENSHPGQLLGENSTSGHRQTRAVDGFQPMPPLTADEYAALRDDNAARGVLVPITVDQHGRLLDGHHRRRIANELGVKCPTEVRPVADDDEAWDLALTLNANRRHLSREQKRELVRAEIARRPGDSDRAIARRVGCSPSTVGAVRGGQVSKLDTLALTPEQHSEIQHRVRWLGGAVVGQLQCRLDPPAVVGELARELRDLGRRRPAEFMEPLRHEYQKLIDWLLDRAPVVLYESWEAVNRRLDWESPDYDAAFHSRVSTIPEGYRLDDFPMTFEELAPVAADLGVPIHRVGPWVVDGTGYWFGPFVGIGNDPRDHPEVDP